MMIEQLAKDQPVPPDFTERSDKVAHNGRTQWCSEAAGRLREKGATWLRYSWALNGSTIVVDGWLQRPINEAPVVWEDKDV